MTLLSQGQSMGYAYNRSQCSHDRIAQFVLGVGKKGELWAGALKELEECAGWDLIVSAVGFGALETNPVRASERALELLSPALFNWEPPAIVGLAWPDRGVPNLGRSWWKSLAGEIKALDGKVGVCCMGGHGRTGTMLAILVPMLGGVKGKKKCPVTWVRKNYCKEAVESDAQLDYVEYITGRPVTVKASDDVKSYVPLPYVAPKAQGVGTGANPTLGLPVAPWKNTSTSTITPIIPPAPAATPIGSTSGEETLLPASKDGWGIPERDEPSDLELLYAWETGDGLRTAKIEGTSLRWSANFDEKGEIVGWTELASS